MDPEGDGGVGGGRRGQRRPLAKAPPCPREEIPVDGAKTVDFFAREVLTFQVDGRPKGCAPHEETGMVGRIVVGRPAGPGMQPFDYAPGPPGRSG